MTLYKDVFHEPLSLLANTTLWPDFMALSAVFLRQMVTLAASMVAIYFAGVVSLTLLLLVARGGRKLLNTSDKIRRMQKSKTIK